MTARRIIPCLDVKDGRVVKGVKFVGHTDMGDAAELAARYRDAGADELVFYDITASPEGRTLDYGWIRDIARLLDIPFCGEGAQTGGRLFVIAGHLVELAVHQAHADAVLQVDGGIDQHVRLRKFLRMVAPASAERSGWNWQPQRLADRTTAGTAPP